jgi:heme/copper-type cytochrome/quinol oxidase subunit 2
MRLRALPDGVLELMQWFGLLGAALIWFAQLLTGWGVTEARCGAANFAWHLNNDAWQITLMAVGVSVALLAEGAAIAVFMRTRELEHDDPPPWGRRNFFAAAAVIGNLLFVMIILLSGIGAIYHSGCRSA